MEKELSWNRPTINKLIHKEANAWTEGQDIYVNLVVKNEQSVKSVIVNASVRIFIQTIIFIALLFLKKFI